MPVDTRYRPPTKVTTCEIPWLSLVLRADPDWARAKHWEREYPAEGAFASGRVFMANPTRRGPYAED